MTKKAIRSPSTIASKCFQLLLLGSISSIAHAEPETPVGFEAEILAAETEGALIYKLDQAVWVASEAAQKVNGFHDDKRIRGWLTEETADGIRITFYGLIKKKPTALYRAFVQSNGLLAEMPAAIRGGEPLSEFEDAQRAAREKAMTIHVIPCSRNYNTVAILRGKPDERSWSFYLLPGSTKQNVMLVGGSYRVDVDWSGEKILAQRTFSKSCLEIPLAKGANGEQVVGSYVTHLLDPTPTPIHVLLSLQHHLMIAVGTTENSQMWFVKDGHIVHTDPKMTENK